MARLVREDDKRRRYQDHRCVSLVTFPGKLTVCISCNRWFFWSSGLVWESREKPII